MNAFWLNKRLIINLFHSQKINDYFNCLITTAVYVHECTEQSVNMSKHLMIITLAFLIIN
jgi:hypothetical protein